MKELFSGMAVLAFIFATILNNVGLASLGLALVYVAVNTP